MAIVVPEEKFNKRLTQRKFDDLYFRYITRDRCVLLFDSIVKILDENKVKIVEFFCGLENHITNCTVKSDRLLDTLSEMEWDYEFVTDDMIRISITSSFWYDVYLCSSISKDTEDYYTELMESDVLNNYRLMDDYMISSRLMFDEIADMQEQFYSTYGEELLPSFMT